MTILEKAYAATAAFVESIPKAHRKRYGQFFTSKMTGNVTSGMIFVTAFLDFKTFKKFSEKLAWGTEVWIADMPDHMIHLNGDKFLGPRK